MTYYNYNKELKTRLLNQQILVLDDIIDKMGKSKNIIKSFENKQCNIRLDKKLKEIKTNSIQESSRYENGYNGIDYNDYKLSFYTTIKHFILVDTKRQYSSCIYVEARYCNINIILYDNSKKINSKETIENIDLKILEFKNHINDIKKSIDQINQMLDDYNHIQEELNRFINKYSLWIRDDLKTRLS